jgi:hypothetical protein
MTAGRDADVDLSIHLPWSPDGAGVIFDNVTLPGILMSFLWGLLLISLVFVFDEPLRVNAADEARDDSSNSRGNDRTSKMGRLANSSTSLFQVIFKNGAFPVSTAPIYPLENRINFCDCLSPFPPMQNIRRHCICLHSLN